MNADIIFHRIPDLGPVFYAAAAAVALGTTLLVVAIGSQLRRWRLHAPALPRPAGLKLRKRATPPTAPAETVRTTETGYTAGSFTGPTETAARRTNGPEIQALADRLGRVADSLEDMRRQLNLEMPDTEFSTLKAEDFGVEYLYKTTSG
ncbi:hypothetical protein CSB20_09215 [bacterium DOLZORAL124_64_63]|nr:MAG: hypothetical protein CSB20_09215 [bacterium DOLZORAL124_64_63]